MKQLPALNGNLLFAVLGSIAIAGCTATRPAQPAPALRLGAVRAVQGMQAIPAVCPPIPASPFSLRPARLLIVDKFHGTATVHGLDVADVVLANAAEPSETGSFSPDGARVGLLVRDGDHDVVRVWNAMTGAPICTCAEADSADSQLVFSPDGQTIAAAGNRGMQVWSATNGALLSSVGKANQLAYAPDGTLVGLTGQAPKTVVFDPPHYAPPRRVVGFDGMGWALVWPASSSRWLAAGQGGVRLCNQSDGSIVATASGVLAVISRPVPVSGGDVCVCITNTGSVHWLSLPQMTLGAKLYHDTPTDGIRGALVAANKSTVMLQSRAGRAVVLAAPSWRSMVDVPPIRADNDECYPISTLSADGLVAAARLDRSTLGVWNAKTGERLAALRPDRHPILAFAVSDDCSWLAVTTVASGPSPGGKQHRTYVWPLQWR